MKPWPVILGIFLATRASADILVSASVDQAHVGFGESITFTITVNGTQSGAQPAIPKIDGLTFAGPSMSQNFSMVNGQTSQSLSLAYQITPTRTGEFIIPAIEVNVGGQTYWTQPIKVTVDKPGAQTELSQRLFAKVNLPSQQIYLGQTVPLEVLIYSRADDLLKGLATLNCDADGLGFKFLNNTKSGTQVINGESFNVVVIQGAISPTHTGTLNFGPCVIKAQLVVPRKNRGGWPFGDSMFDEMMGRVEVREVPVTIDAVPVEVLPLQEEGRPADFTGAVGQWNLEVTAKPTDVAVGDPITLTMKISGTGNIDTVATPQLKLSDNFKTYDPTSKTTKNELSTTGERVFQQVLIPKSTEATELPEVRLSYFDPAGKTYKTAAQGPIKLFVKAGGPGASALVAGTTRTRATEKLGEDIVYLKGDRGPVASSMSWPVFWALNITPVIALAGAIGWKRRSDRLRGDVAYARRSRAARRARKVLVVAHDFDGVQRALQSYLGDRLNIPASGITASVAEEHGLPPDVAGVFAACDAARFAGAPTDLAVLKQTVERVIDELENANV
jgi:hypothetical protein